MRNFATLSYQELLQELRSSQSKVSERRQGNSYEALLHELQVYEIELEMQNRELRTTQAALEQSRDRYARLYDFAPVGLLTLNAAGTIARINFAASAMIGYDRRFLTGFALCAFLAQSERRGFRSFLSECGRTGSGEGRFTLVRNGTPIALILYVVREEQEAGIEFQLALTPAAPPQSAGRAPDRLAIDETLDAAVRERTAELEAENSALREEVERLAARSRDAGGEEHGGAGDARGPTRGRRSEPK